MENTAKSDEIAEINKLKEKLHWLKPNDNDYPITEFERLKQRMMRNPLVPIGFIGTVVVLTLGLRSVLKGNQKQSQLMMRWRVGLQCATIGIFIGGIYMHSYLQDKEKED